MSSLRARIGGLLPARLRYLLWQRVGPRLGLGRSLGHQVPGAIDLSVLDALRAADDGALCNPAQLEHVILPGLGLNEEVAELFPSSLSVHLGHGLRASQYPKQFAPYLAHLVRYPISSYLEIGVQHGGTFIITVEYLDRFCPLRQAVAVDMFDVASLRAYDRSPALVRSLRVDSRSRRARRLLEKLGPFDLVMIDGDHAEQGCRADFELVKDSARMIAFHDIVGSNTPGVARVWVNVREAFADRYDFFEFNGQYEDIVARTGETYMGIGLAVRKDFAPSGQ